MSSRKSSSSSSRHKSSSKARNENPDGVYDISFGRWVMGGRLVSPVNEKISVKKRDASRRVVKVVEIARGQQEEEVVESPPQEMCDDCKTFWKAEKEKAEATPAVKEAKTEKDKATKKDSCCAACEQEKAEKEKDKSAAIESGKSKEKEKKNESGKSEESAKDDKADKKDSTSFTKEEDAQIIAAKDKNTAHKQIAAELKRDVKDVSKRITELSKEGKLAKKGKKNNGDKDDKSSDEKAENSNDASNDTDNIGWGGMADLDAGGGTGDATNSSWETSNDTSNTNTEQRIENTGQGGWNPPEDAWGANSTTDWPQTQDNDPNGTMISSNGNTNSGSDWVTDSKTPATEAPVYMSGANGDGITDNFSTWGTPSVPQTIANKAFTEGTLPVNNTSTSIFGDDASTQYFTNFKPSGSATNNKENTNKVHWDDTNIAATKNATTNATPVSSGGWGSSGDSWGGSASTPADSTPAVPEVVSGPMSSAWENNAWTNQTPTQTPAIAPTIVSPPAVPPPPQPSSSSITIDKDVLATLLNQIANATSTTPAVPVVTATPPPPPPTPSTNFDWSTIAALLPGGANAAPLPTQTPAVAPPVASAPAVPSAAQPSTTNLPFNLDAFMELLGGARNVVTPATSAAAPPPPTMPGAFPQSSTTTPVPAANNGNRDDAHYQALQTQLADDEELRQMRLEAFRQTGRVLSYDELRTARALMNAFGWGR